MAVVVAVHGTFAHVESEPGAPPTGPQWWQADSAFMNDIRELVDARDRTLEVTHFTWSGDNSEVGRREAGSRLLAKLRELEALKADYCLVGHSHGGGVIAAALLESAARREPLNGLKRWITVGTPFVRLRKERWLFTRLDLMRKVVFVASMTLLLMFLVYLASDLASGKPMLFGTSFQGVLAVQAAMMSLPAITLYAILKYLDYRGNLQYRQRVRARAQASFAKRWLSLTHAEDEAVQGLAYLPQAKLQFFDRTFAVSTLTLASVLMVPLLYLSVVTSPTLMVGLGGWLKTNVYEARTSPEVEKVLRELRSRLDSTKKQGDESSPDVRDQRRAAWREYRDTRRSLQEKHPEFESAERALRFKRRFFERDGAPCDGGRLCGAGNDIRINSALLLHVVTDELSWMLGAEETRDWGRQTMAAMALPVVLVPVLAGLVALLLMLLIRNIAHVISSFSSTTLNQLTSSEVKRAAFGNDTEGEIALGALDYPNWIDEPRPRLPQSLATRITDFSNNIAGQSLVRIRKAIGQFAALGPQESATSVLTTYLTWKELVHGSYFDVPEFRKLVAQAVSRADGFTASAKFRADPDYARTAQWLAELEEGPAAEAAAGEDPPDSSDVKAVAAVVASTVKAEP